MRYGLYETLKCLILAWWIYVQAWTKHLRWYAIDCLFRLQYYVHLNLQLVKVFWYFIGILSPNFSFNPSGPNKHLNKILSDFIYFINFLKAYTVVELYHMNFWSFSSMCKIWLPLVLLCLLFFREKKFGRNDIFAP